MRTIDMESWPRREHFKVFGSFDHPHFGMCANVDLTTFYAVVKQHGHSINAAIVYVLARAANDIPEFRQRIRAGAVVEHDVVHPSATIMADEDLFSFCTFNYVADFAAFAAGAAATIAYVRAHPTLKDEPGRDDLLFMSAIPWVSFTSFMHPLHLQPADSVPRLAWGEFFEDGARLRMPLDVQVHHALMDGVHVGRYYEAVQGYLDHPDFIAAKA
jgi:chloramphenicol O-acetyltransferase type A